MSRIWNTAFGALLLGMTLVQASCKKDPEPDPNPDTTAGTTSGTTSGIPTTGELRVTHRILTPAGAAAADAECAIAITGDSLDNRLYFETGTTDVDGVYIYKNLPPGEDYGLFAKKFWNGDSIRVTTYFIKVEQNKLRNENIALK